jgi:uncharacterized protein YjbI with pentapeptide repeats
VHRGSTRRRAAAFALVAVVLGASPSVSPAAVSDTDKLEAEVAKLRAEAKKLEGDNGLGARLPGYGALFAAVVAFGGLLFNQRQQRNDRRKDRADALDQAERDSIRRFDEQFAQIVATVTSGVPAVRASAAASIQAFLKPEHYRFHEQVVTLLSANLKFPRDDVTDRILGATYAQALRDHRDNLVALCGPGGPDLLEATLKRANLSGLDLSGCDMFRANLHGTDFSEAQLVKVRAHSADLSSAAFTKADVEAAQLQKANLGDARFRGARLVSTKLQQASAQHAAFDGASLQEANFDGADLRAASFRGADLNNAFFRGTQFDEPALSSILDAENWRKANFDEEVRKRLEEMDAAG